MGCSCRCTHWGTCRRSLYKRGRERGVFFKHAVFCHKSTLSLFAYACGNLSSVGLCDFICVCDYATHNFSACFFFPGLAAQHSRIGWAESQPVPEKANCRLTHQLEKPQAVLQPTGPHWAAQSNACRSFTQTLSDETWQRPGTLTLFAFLTVDSQAGRWSLAYYKNLHWVKIQRPGGHLSWWWLTVSWQKVRWR